MNKNIHRYDATDHISKIQANLKEMKHEVSDYLKKHSKDKIPPIIRPRHYLLVDAINDLIINTHPLNPNKMMKDLSSEKLGHVADEDHF